MAEASKIEVKHSNLNDIIYEMSKGILRIPRFQRDYVWERTRVAKLFDSIYKEFPIGSFFLWITPPEFRKLYKDIKDLNQPEPDEYQTIKMILDGQQRITSLFVTARGLELSFEKGKTKDYKKICFDLDREEFLVVKRNEDKERIIAVWRFFDVDDKEEVYDKLSPERRKIFKKCQRILTNYPMSVVEVKDVHLEEAIRIFERINQGGKRLGLFDLVVANTWSNDFDLKEKVKELNEKLEDKGFGRIAEEVVAQLLSLIIKGQATRAFQFQLTNKEITDNWARVEEAIESSVDYLRNNFGVKIYEFIPYPSMIAMVSYVFAKNKGRSLSPTQAEFIEKWFWRSAFSQRYSASTLTVIGSDIHEYFDKLLNGEKVEFNIPVNLSVESIEKIRIHTRSAIKNAIFCMLAINSPKHFKDNSIIALDRSLCSEFNNHEKHHIFPKAFLSKNHIGRKHLLLNFSFIPGELNREIKKVSPADYFLDYKKSNKKFLETMDSHLIQADKDAGIWNNDYNKFIRERSGLFLRTIGELTGGISEMEIKMEESPLNLLENLEKEIRTYLHGKLSLTFGDDYWKKVPGDIQERVQDKIVDLHRRHPYEQDREIVNSERFNFCDIMDYNQIILSNWGVFSDDFGSKSEAQKHFLNLKEYRNSLMHGRDMNSVIKKQGEASIEWLSRVIGLELEDEVPADGNEEEDSD